MVVEVMPFVFQGCWLRIYHLMIVHSKLAFKTNSGKVVNFCLSNKWLHNMNKKARRTRERTFKGGMLSAAMSITLASLISWWLLSTHWTNKFGSQLWLMNLARLPVPAASMQNGTLSDDSSTIFFKWDGTDTSLSRLWKVHKKYLASIGNKEAWRGHGELRFLVKTMIM